MLKHKFVDVVLSIDTSSRRDKITGSGKLGMVSDSEDAHAARWKEVSIFAESLASTCNQGKAFVQFSVGLAGLVTGFQLACLRTTVDIESKRRLALCLFFYTALSTSLSWSNGVAKVESVSSHWRRSLSSFR